MPSEICCCLGLQSARLCSTRCILMRLGPANTLMRLGPANTGCSQSWPTTRALGACKHRLR
eukprot:1153129-Pelagomonas_calceolata.AAC.2